MLTLYGAELFLAAAARHGAISLARDPEAGSQGVGRRDRHRLAAARIGTRAHRPRLLGADRGARLPRAAQYRRLPHGQGGDRHGADGARAVRHRLGQARSDRQRRHACSRICSAWSRRRRALSADGFEVLPYTTEDLSAAERLVAAGCAVLMPWAAPIGSARGLINKDALKTLRAYFPDIAARSSMPESARPRTRPRRWKWATTRCCSTPPSPRRAIR